jgi:hypothetical protein
MPRLGLFAIARGAGLSAAPRARVHATLGADLSSRSVIIFPNTDES